MRYTTSLLFLLSKRSLIPEKRRDFIGLLLYSANLMLGLLRAMILSTAGLGTSYFVTFGRSARRALLYGLPKVPKEDMPLLLIAACIEAPTQRLGKFMAAIIEQSFESYKTFRGKDALDLAERIGDRGLPRGYVLTFEVQSLFISISL